MHPALRLVPSINVWLPVRLMYICATDFLSPRPPTSITSYPSPLSQTLKSILHLQLLVSGSEYNPYFKVGKEPLLFYRTGTLPGRHLHHCTSLYWQNLVDMEIFLVCQSVEDGLRRHDSAPCLVYCHENRSKLRRIKSQLEFQVRLQDFIELVRSNRRTDAIKWVIVTVQIILLFEPSVLNDLYREDGIQCGWVTFIHKLK